MRDRMAIGGELFGVLASGGSYQVFYEHLSGREPAWGCAVSDDLIIWTEQAAGTPPSGGSARCGTVVAGPDGPVLFHTLEGGEVGRAIAPAGPGVTVWHAEPSGPLLGGPPSGVTEIRDPYVFWAGSNWRMLLGARLIASLRRFQAGLQVPKADKFLHFRQAGIGFVQRTQVPPCCLQASRVDVQLT